MSVEIKIESVLVARRLLNCDTVLMNGIPFCNCPGFPHNKNYDAGCYQKDYATSDEYISELIDAAVKMGLNVRISYKDGSYQCRVGRVGYLHRGFFSVSRQSNSFAYAVTRAMIAAMKMGVYENETEEIQDTTD